MAVPSEESDKRKAGDQTNHLGSVDQGHLTSGKGVFALYFVGHSFDVGADRRSAAEDGRVEEDEIDDVPAGEPQQRDGVFHGLFFHSFLLLVQDLYYASLPVSALSVTLPFRVRTFRRRRN